MGRRLTTPDHLPDDPHRRLDPLAGEWVLVSAGRIRRPWQGSAEPAAADARPAYDPTCFLCPGNVRASGVANPPYASTFVFENDFAALRPETAAWSVDDGLLRAVGERGTCRVLCFSPRHDLDLGRMAPADVRGVVDAWAGLTEELGRTYGWVQVFENRGQAMGASSPHPHGQVWATASLPRDAAREDTTQREHHARTGRRMLLDYAAQESGGTRVVAETEDWLVVVPFWATWPFETLVIPRGPAGRLPDLDGARRDDLAAILTGLFARYDALCGVPFPYSMGWHQAPFAGPGGDRAGAARAAARSVDHWQLHAHVYPPLLDATRRKFMVGYELLSEAQRDFSPEEAAARLREARPREARPGEA